MQARANEIKDNSVGDAPMQLDLVSHIPKDAPSAIVSGDGAYDTRVCAMRPLPPQTDAGVDNVAQDHPTVVSHHYRSAQAQRSAAQLGRRIWKAGAAITAGVWWKRRCVASSERMNGL